MTEEHNHPAVPGSNADPGANQAVGVPPSGDAGASEPGERGASDAAASPAQAAETPAGPVKKEEGHDASMSLLEHLTELRRRLWYAFLGALAGFLLCYGFSERLFDLLCLPLINVLPPDSKLIYTGLPEGFLTNVKISFIAGIFIGSPYIFYQFWAFVAPGLYEHEKRHIIPIALLSAVFFICGAAFGYFFVFPLAFEFFMSYNSQYIAAMPKLSEYLDFSLKLLVAFGVVFELPLVAFFLGRLGLLTVGMMRRGRRYAILGIFILAAVLTPPDVASQLCMAVPLLLLYELSILIVMLFGKKKPEDAEQNPA